MKASAEFDGRNVSTLRLGAIAGFLGVVAQLWLSGQHAGVTNPNDSLRVFQEYAESGTWTLVHIGQYAGTFLIAVCLYAVYRSMRQESGLSATFAGLAAVAITMVLAVFAVQMAVDGVALRETILAWINAAPTDKPAAFLVADGVRWIEKGLSAFFHLNNGTAFAALGVAVVAGRTFPRWIGLVGVVAGVGAITGGIVAAHTGFSPESAAILGPTSIVGVLFLGALCVSMWRQSLGARTPAIGRISAPTVA